MKKLLERLAVVSVFLAVAVSGAHAAPIACTAGGTTMDVLLGLNAGGGCYSQDKLFTDFVYTPTAGGLATAASGVTATLLFQQLGGVDVHGWTFSDSWSQNVVTGQLAGFTVGYTIKVCASGDPCFGSVVPGTSIIGADANFAPIAGLFAPSEVVTWTGGGTVTLNLLNSGPLPTPYNNGIVSGLGPFTVSAVYNGSGGLSATTLRFYELVPGNLPEPATFVLFGTGLVGLGWLRRRRRART